MRMKLFGERIEPACHYCEYGLATLDPHKIACKKHGTVSAYDSCRNYRYAPLKRIPNREASLPRYSRQDFEL